MQLDKIRVPRLYPKKGILFMKGDPPRGIFLLCSGLAKLTFASAQGREVIVRMVRRGEAMGLDAVLLNQPFELTAVTQEPAQISFISRSDFLCLLQRNKELSLFVAQYLSKVLRRSDRQVARNTLRLSPEEKLSDLLLDCASHGSPRMKNGVLCRLNLTQREIGQLIGLSRESVSRHLRKLQSRGLIRNRRGLIEILGSSKPKVPETPKVNHHGRLADLSSERRVFLRACED